jgi:quercetin dioxygenase-like cupin family protein
VPTTKNPPAQFAGDVWLDPIALPHRSDQTMVVATVRFAPGAQTAWHSHQHGQYLRVTQDIGRFGARDGKIIYHRRRIQRPLNRPPKPSVRTPQ